MTLYYGDNQLEPEELLEASGRKVEQVVLPGQSFAFSDECDNLQAVFIKEAKLQVIGDIGPTESTRVYRDGSDFGCRDVLQFTFTQSVTATDLDISFSSRQP